MKKEARKNRGEVTEDYLKSFSNLKVDDLIRGLYSSDTCIRTASARTLGERKEVSSVEDLCFCIKSEKALYSRIAMSEALGSIGIQSLKELIKLVGKVGSNQHKVLPEKIFKKWNYPLPRDIIIRTIVKIGEPALETLRNELFNISDLYVISELVDAVGYISYYTGDNKSFNNLISLYNKYAQDKVIVWKIIRALQSFDNNENIGFLTSILLTSEVPAHRWEAARSLGQIGANSAIKSLESALNDNSENVKEMAGRAINKILHKH